MATAEAPTVGRRTKSIQEYFDEPMTTNQAGFLKFVLESTGVHFSTKAEEEAFARGVKAAGLYSRYQASKRIPATTASQPAAKKVQPRRAPQRKAS